ncbi:MAG: NUDIX hydrolase [Bacteroidota bacterium]
MFKILKENIIFNDLLIIEKAEISDEHDNNFSRLRLKRQDASAVLILNTETDKIILTKQFRYAISSKIKEQILEIVAGKIDEGEKPLQAAIREVEEEVGYRIKPENIQLLVSCFASPGYSSECFYIYYATVTNVDKISEGGGLETENEYISVVELSSVEFKSLIKTGNIKDAKTYIAGLYLALQ